MKCWICSRQARGLRHTDIRYRVTDPRHYPTDWAFCSRRCQDAFHALYGRWTEAPFPRERSAMVDATGVEEAAMRHCLKFLGEVAEGIGFDKPLGRYSEAEALHVVDAIVTAYTEAMVKHHEQHRHPAIRGLEVTEIDPIRIDLWSSDLDPVEVSPPPMNSPCLSTPRSMEAPPKTAFDDMPSDAPWETVDA